MTFSDDRAAILQAARQALAGYARLPFYAQMFAAAGYPVEEGGVSDALIEQLVVRGDQAAVSRRVRELLDAGLDELLLTVLPLGDVAAARSRLFQLVGQL